MTDQPIGNLLSELFDFGGRVSRAVFLTYTFDPQYFTDVIQPALRELNCEHTLVLMDATQYQRATGLGELRNDGRLVIERFRPGVTFHPKLFLLTGVTAAGENMMRGAIGSANLTENGLEHNRELFTILTGQNGFNQTLADLLMRVRGELRFDPTAAELLRETAAELHAIPRVAIDQASAELVRNGLGAPRLWTQLNDHIPTGQLEKAVIVSPFFEAPEKFDHGLIGEILKAGAEVHLYVEDTGSYELRRYRGATGRRISFRQQPAGTLRTTHYRPLYHPSLAQRLVANRPPIGAG